MTTRRFHAAALWLLLSASVFGQATYGTIFGTVTDASGAPVPDVKITVISQDRGITSSTATNESGNYSKTQLQAGSYELDFERQGFQRVVQKDVAVSVDRGTRIDVQLKVGEVQTQVEVTGAPPALVTDRAEVSTSLSSMQVQDLPILNRNLTSLQLLMPGAQNHIFQHASSENPQGGLQINNNGQQFGSTNFTVDGIDNNNPVLGIINVNPNVDSVQEFKYTTGNYDAELAQAGGAAIEVSTRSGTNALHGSLFEFLQNDIMNARNSFSEPKGPPPLRWNQFGGSLGGPIKKNKLFAFGDYQGTRRRTGASLLTTTPTAAERNGDFSALGVPIYNPATGDANGAGRAQFLNNQIPLNQISQPAKNLLALLPLPNFGPPGAFNNNYIATGSELFDTNQFDLRVDHDVSDKLKYFARYTYAGFLKNSPPAYGPKAGGPGLSGLLFAGNAEARNQNLGGGMNYILGPTFLSDFRFGFSRYRVDVLPLDFGSNTDEAAGLPGLNLPNRPDTSGISAFTIPGSGGFNFGYSTSINQCNCLLHERYQLFQLANTWTKILGNHSFKWGADVRRAQNIRVPSDNRRNGNFTFSPSVTGAAGVSGSGLSVASYLLGLPSQFVRFAEQKTDPEDMQWSMYYFAQDTWRVTSKLTFSYGLRWDTWFPDRSVHAGEGSRYDVTTNSILVAGVGGNSKSANVNTQWHNFSPRLAIAYQLNPKTVIRTGFGRSYYQEIFGFTFNNIANSYPTLITQAISQPTTFTGAFSLAQGPPAVVFPQVPPNGILQLPNLIGANYLPADIKYPYVDSWNFSVERLLAGDMTATVSYVANAGRHQKLGVLSPRGIPLNQAIPGPGPLNPRRPLFNKFGLTQSITDLSDGGSNSYESLQTKLTKRFSRNYSLLLTYTWSKTIDTQGGLELNNRLNRGPADYDRAHVFTAGHIWQLPFGKGRQYLANTGRPVDYLLGGWQFSGITTFESGVPFSPTLINTSSINADIPSPDFRPDRILSIDPTNVPGGQNRDHWFNPAAYQVPGPFLFGTAGRNSLRGPNLFTADWSLDKRFAITEHKSLQLRWEVYNVFNRTNLADPTTQGAAPGSPIDAGANSVARITNLLIGTNMRRMQLGLRLDF
ncbi:MAG: carboxypeptidase regulatory-like domain-containing protein [Bryobacteraceae bacterium]